MAILLGVACIVDESRDVILKWVLVLFVVLLLCLVDLVQHCDHFVTEEGACYFFFTSVCGVCDDPASILYKSIAGRYRPVSYPDGPTTARYRFIKNAYWGYRVG